VYYAENMLDMKSGIHLRQVINKLNEIDFNNSKDKHILGKFTKVF
jgi:type I restriction enzyme M protein